MEPALDLKPKVCFEFEVEKILNVSSDGRYQVQWAPAWVSKFHLVGCEHLVEVFRQQQADLNVKIEPIDQTEVSIDEATEIEGEVRMDEDETDEFIIGDPVEPSAIKAETEYAVTRNEASVGIQSVPLTEDSRNFQGAENKDENDQCQMLVINANETSISEELSHNCAEEPKYQQSEPLSSIRDTPDHFPTQVSLESLPSTRDTSEHFPTQVSLESLASTRDTSENFPTQVSLESLASTRDPTKHFPTQVSPSDSFVYKENTALSSSSRSTFDYDTWQQGTNSDIKHPCPRCSSSYSRLRDLDRHVRRIHKGEGSFSCPHCGKMLSRKDHLVRHVRTHTGERPYGCELCEKRFADKAGLNKHMKHAHTSEKMYSNEQYLF